MCAQCLTLQHNVSGHELKHIRFLCSIHVLADAAVPTPEDKAAAHEYLMMEFVLTLLNNAIKKGVLIGRDPSTLGYLDPLLPLLVRALACRQSATVGLALKLLSGLVGLPLPGLAVAASSAGKAVTVLLKRVPDLSHPVAQDCFRLLSGMFWRLSY